MSSRSRRLRIVVQLGIGQTIGYASSYYLPAVLATDISGDLGLTYSTFYLLISGATIVSVIAGPSIGRWIDSSERHAALALSTPLFALGLVGMALAPSAAWFIGSWVVLSGGAALGLYDAAFATVVRLEGQSARRVIAGITLIAGFASSIGWPLTALLSDTWGWRSALLVWAALHLLINLPLYLFLPGVTLRRQLSIPHRRAPVATSHSVPIDRGVILFGLMLAMGGFIQGAMGLHLIPVLEANNVPPTSALWAATLLGPGQVLARLLQLLFPQLFVPRAISVASLGLHLIAVAALWSFGAPAAALFAFIHGMGSGFYTVAAGTMPLEIYGSRNYGQRQGYILGISKAVTIATPFAFSFAVLEMGRWSLAITSAASVVGLILLAWLLRMFQNQAPEEDLRNADPATIETGPIDIPDETELR